MKVRRPSTREKIRRIANVAWVGLAATAIVIAVVQFRSTSFENPDTAALSSGADPDGEAFDHLRIDSLVVGLLAVPRGNTYRITLAVFGGDPHPGLVVRHVKVVSPMELTLPILEGSYTRAGPGLAPSLGGFLEAAELAGENRERILDSGGDFVVQVQLLSADSAHQLDFLLRREDVWLPPTM